MTLLGALPKTTIFDPDINDDREVVANPCAGLVSNEQGDLCLEGYSLPEWIQAHYADFVDLPVPLTEEQFEALLQASTPLWQRSWQMWRDQGII